MTAMRHWTVEEAQRAATKVADRIITNHPKSGVYRLFGIPRGGVTAAALVATALAVRGKLVTPVDDPLDADVFVDDIVDSGETRDRWMEQYPGLPFYALTSRVPGEWQVFPWEKNVEGSAEDIPIRLLQYIGEDPQRGGLRETPQRFLKAWKEWGAGYEQDPTALLKTFEDGAERYDEMVLVRDIPIYSHCEHHLAPFFGKAHIAYIPDRRIVGLSKLARLAECFARRLQVQERLTSQIAHALQDALHPVGVGVVLECRHLCMESRGVRAPGTSTTTSCLLGALKEEEAARAEFMRLVR